MDTQNQLARVETGAMQQTENHSLMRGAGRVTELLEQVALIQQVMRETMKDGEHYGLIPGCGKKPSLLKPGAEKLSFVFRLNPEFGITEQDLGNGHREVKVLCTLKQIGTGVTLGQGVGSCSTMEAKYRYRTGPKESTGQAVPKAYWDLRKTDPVKAQEAIGGKGFSTMKNDLGGWEICMQGEKVEHENPADYYNTVLKMAKKRAHVDAVLTATAASDLFTQDVEDIVENRKVIEPEVENGTMPRGARQPQNQTQPAGEGADWRKVRFHFGKMGPQGTKPGIMLGELTLEDLQWWGETWTPKPFNGKIGAMDQNLRDALDMACISSSFAQPPKGTK